MDDAERQRIVDELAALICSDLMTSGAKTAGEMTDAIVATVAGVMAPPEITSIEVNEDGRTATVHFSGPSLPGMRD